MLKKYIKLTINEIVVFEFRLQRTAFFQTAPGRSGGVMTQSKRMRYNLANGRSYDQALKFKGIAHCISLNRLAVITALSLVVI